MSHPHDTVPPQQAGGLRDEAGRLVSVIVATVCLGRRGKCTWVLYTTTDVRFRAEGCSSAALCNSAAAVVDLAVGNGVKIVAVSCTHAFWDGRA